MFCTNCGKEIENGSVFCTNCGAKQTVEESAAPDISKIEPIEPVAEEQETLNTDQSELMTPSVPNVGGMATTPIGPNPVTPVIPEAKPVVTATNPESAPTSGGKKSKMSPITMGIIAVAVIVVLFLLFGGGGGGNKDYKALVEDYYNAIYKEDFNALVKCYDKDDQKDLKEDKEDIQEDLEDVKENYDDRYDRGWNKKIDVKSRSKVDSDDDVTYYTVAVEIDEENTEYVAVKKFKDKYYIDSKGDLF